MNVILLVKPPDGSNEIWRFGIKAKEVISIDLNWETPEQVAASVAWQYGAFQVLPPADQLPKKPSGHDLSVRSGDARVDQVIKALQDRDPWEVRSLIDYQQIDCRVSPNPECPADISAEPYVRFIPGRDCSRQPMGATRAEAWLDSLSAKGISIHTVADLPAGYEPAGTHLIIINMENSPYSWYAIGLIEALGRIAGIVVACYAGPQDLYPPLALPLPPSQDGEPYGDIDLPVALVDAFLKALNAADVSRLMDLVAFQPVPCVLKQQGPGSPPLCRPDESEGTLIDTLLEGACEGVFLRREEAEAYFRGISSTAWRAYVIADLGGSDSASAGFGFGRIAAVLVPETKPQGLFVGATEFRFTKEGLASIRASCGNISPAAMLSSGVAPSFLLPPR